VATLPIENSPAVKRTNEIKMAIPRLEAIDIQGKAVSADALLTQRQLADYRVIERKAHYHFTVKANQPGVLQDLGLYFQDRGRPHCVEQMPPDHGRIETRKIWTTTELNHYLDFPHVGQAFVIERHSLEKKSGESSLDIAYGITRKTPEQANPQQLLRVNRQHWCLENSCHYILDWNYDEDRSRIRTGHGPENITRLRRFAIGIIKSKGVRSVAQKMRQLTRNVRLVFDYLRMTHNSCARPRRNFQQAAAPSIRVPACTKLA
jgi:predicted transposase YbfD/YdcC